MTNHIASSELKMPNQLTDNEINYWESICKENNNLSSPFYSYYFSLATFLSGRDVRVCILYQDSLPVAFIPFQFRNTLYRLLGVAERVANNLNDYFGIIASEDFTITPEQLRHFCNLNYFSFSHLRENQLGFGLSGEDPTPSPIVNFKMDDLQLNSKQRRKKVHFEKETERRLNRASNELGAINFEFKSANVEQELSRCIDQKRAQYKRTGSPDPLTEKYEQKILYELACYNYASCSGILSTLYAGDTWLASHFGLINETEMHYWFPVYNPDFVEYSAGRILITKMIEATKLHKLKLFDFGAGTSQMKRKFSNDEITVLKGTWRNNSFSALAYQTALSSQWKYRSLMKKIQN